MAQDPKTASQTSPKNAEHAVPAAFSLHGGTLHGEAVVPGDKSISHRALMLSSQAIGTTQVSGLLEGEDVLHTADALRALGVSIRRLHAQRWEIKGVGIGGLALHDMGRWNQQGSGGPGSPFKNAVEQLRRLVTAALHIHLHAGKRR